MTVSGRLFGCHREKKTATAALSGCGVQHSFMNVKKKVRVFLMMWGYDFGWAGMVLMSLSMVLWIALLVVLVWAVIHWLDRRTSVSASSDTRVPPGGPSALDILRQRYARGEIDTATFEQTRERLEASGVRDSELATSKR